MGASGALTTVSSRSCQVSRKSCLHLEIRKSNSRSRQLLRLFGEPISVLLRSSPTKIQAEDSLLRKQKWKRNQISQSTVRVAVVGMSKKKNQTHQVRGTAAAAAGRRSQTPLHARTRVSITAGRGGTPSNCFYSNYCHQRAN